MTQKHANPDEYEHLVRRQGKMSIKGGKHADLDQGIH